MDEKRALSWQQFMESGFDGREYQFPNFEGTFRAKLVCKRWDKHQKLVAYLNFEDGRKIVTAAWQNTNYMGLAEIPLGTTVELTFQASTKGVPYLRNVEIA